MFPFDCVIEYKARKENLAADSLSWMMMLSWSEPQVSILQKIEQATIKNVALQELIQLCKQQPESQTNYTIKGNLLYWKNRVVIPEEKELIQMLLVRGSFGWRLSCSWRDFTQTGIWLGVDCIVVFVGIGIQVFCWMLGEGCSVGRINGSFFKDSVFVLDVVQFPSHSSWVSICTFY